ncbi:MAG: tetratricopeptide repeat protein [Acidibrevibacterium sp.]|uniref:tetratricopeptide repeat protein n=1 Tax=Acidibrevibacterium sp. TaxID=2606776 RepID=UPI003CFEE9B5
MRQIAFLGNCQIDTLYLAYRDYVLPFCDDRARYIEIYKNIKDEDKAFLADSDIVITQKLDTTHEVNLQDFDIKAKIHYVPYVNFSGGYWPYGGFPHPKSKKFKIGFDFEPYNAEIGDLYLNRFIEKNTNPDECVNRYLNEDINKVVKLDRRLEMTLGMIERQDKICGYSVTPFIRDNFQKELLFSSPGHFRRSISLLLINELFGRLNVEPRLIARLNKLYPGNPHASSDITPIHPQVAAHFGLKFIADNQRYRYWFEGRFTFAEYCHRYARCAFNESLVEAILLAIEGRNDEAIPHFEQALRLSPQSGYGHVSFSHSLTALGRYAEALAKAEAAAAILADDPEELPNVLEHLGHCLLNAGEPAQAEVNFRAALTLAPNRSSLYRALSSSLDREGRREEANAIIQDLIALDPLDYEAEAHLGHMFAAQGKIEASEQAFRRSLAINPRQAGTLGAISHSLAGLGRREEAIEKARASLALNPHDARVQAHLGRLLSEAGEHSAAIAAHRAALALEPENADFQHWLAEALARQERFQTASAAEGDMLRREGERYFHEGKFAEAEHAFRAALAHDDRDPNWHWWLSASLDLQGRKADAAAAAEEAARRAPSEARYWEHLGHMRAAAGEIEAAKAAFSRACEIEPDRASALGALSHTLGALQLWEEAIAAARAALLLLPEDANLFFHLGNLLIQAGSPIEAAAAYRQAIALGRAGEDVERQLAEALRRAENIAATLAAEESAEAAAPAAPEPISPTPIAVAPITPEPTTPPAPESDRPRHGFWQRIFAPRQVFGP